MHARLPLIAALALAASTLVACATNEDESALERAGDKTAELLDDATDGDGWDRIQGNWSQLSGSAKARWGELTDDDMAQLDGNKDQLIGRIQEAYGIARNAAEEQVDEWAAGQ